MNVFHILKELEDVVSDVVDKSKKEMELFSEGKALITLPEQDLLGHGNFRFGYYRDVLTYQDRLIQLMVRIDLVVTQLRDINKSTLPRGEGIGIKEIKMFKENIEHWISQLDSIKFSVIEMKRCAIDRLKLLQSMFYDIC